MEQSIFDQTQTWPHMLGYSLPEEKQVYLAIITQGKFTFRLKVSVIWCLVQSLNFKQNYLWYVFIERVQVRSENLTLAFLRKPVLLTMDVCLSLDLKNCYIESWIFGIHVPWVSFCFILETSLKKLSVQALFQNDARSYINTFWK